MANAGELTRTVDRLEERVTNHIRFFWAAVALGFVWLAAITGYIANTNSKVNVLALAQADAPSKIITAMLNKSQSSKAEMVSSLAAVATILRTAPVPQTRPQRMVLENVSSEIVKAQASYPELLETWQATTAFIKYRSSAILPPESREILSNASRVLSCGDIRQAGGAMVLTGCTLDLENGVSTTNALFVHCVIRYRGGPIPIRNARFVDCLFDIEIDNTPSAQAKSLMAQMTTSDTGDFKVLVSG